LSLWGRLVQSCHLRGRLLFLVSCLQKRVSGPVLVKQYLFVTNVFTWSYATFGFPEAGAQTIHVPVILKGTFDCYLQQGKGKLYSCSQVICTLFYQTTGGQHFYEKEDCHIICLVHTFFFPKLLHLTLPQFRCRVSFHTKTTEINELNSYVV